MNSGYYASATGMISQEVALDHMASNIRNAQVSGYKKSEIIFSSFDHLFDVETAKWKAGAETEDASGIELIQGYTDFSQGKLRYSGENTDLAIEGPGFFKVDTGNGEYFMRSGQLHVNQNLELVTREGYRVVDESGGPIFFDSSLADVSGTFNLRDDGTVFVVDKAKGEGKVVEAGKIGLYDFNKPENLTRHGYSLWSNTGDSAEQKIAGGKFRSGYQELSNVNIVESMVEMILNQRIYETNANCLKQIHANYKDFIGTIVS